MAHVFMQIFFMQRVMRMEFCPHNNVWTIIMYVHAVCDMHVFQIQCMYLSISHYFVMGRNS